MTQIDRHGAGFQRNRVRFQRPDERLRHDFDLVPAQRTDAQLTQRTANMTVMVDKSEHALRGMVAQGTGDSGEGFAVEPDVVFPVGQNRIVTPDHPVAADCVRQPLESFDPPGKIRQAVQMCIRDRMYGAAGAGFIRLNIACPRTLLAEELDRLRKVLELRK